MTPFAVLTLSVERHRRHRLHDSTKVTLTACRGADDGVMMRPVHTSCYSVAGSHTAETFRRRLNGSCFEAYFLKGRQQLTPRDLSPLTLNPPHTEQMVTMVLDTELQMWQESGCSLEGTILVFLPSSEGPCRFSPPDCLSGVSEWPSQLTVQLLSSFESVVRPEEAGESLVGVDGSLSLAAPLPSCSRFLGLS